MPQRCEGRFFPHAATVLPSGSEQLTDGDGGSGGTQQHAEWAEGRRYFTFTDNLDAKTLTAKNILGARCLNNINKDDFTHYTF